MELIIVVLIAIFYLDSLMNIYRQQLFLLIILYQPYICNADSISETAITNSYPNYSGGTLYIPRVDTNEQIGFYQDVSFTINLKRNNSCTCLKSLSTNKISCR